MCSIIGYNGVYDKELVNKICFNSRIRGLHSFGYSFNINKTIQVFKFLDYDKFIQSLNDHKPNVFIAHFRYSTSGDYRTELNNQPISIDNLSMVFNGVIDMGTKANMESKYGVKLISENDGELALLKKLESNESFERFVNGRSFSGLFLNNNNEIEIFRNNNRPAHIGYLEDIKVVGSTKDILIRSGIERTKQIETNKIIKL